MFSLLLIAAIYPPVPVPTQLERSYEQIIQPLESFRKEAIGGAKEGRKKFEKQTQKFCQSQERYLNLSTKKDGQVLQEVSTTDPSRDVCMYCGWCWCIGMVFWAYLHGDVL